jgi:membrane associated rhomboid family serine protease
MLILIPIRVDVPMTRPWMNYALMAVTTVISIWAFFDETVFRTFAHFGLSCLLHGGWLHLAGNMLFLWVFGNAVNYKFGHVGYLLLYAACAVAGDAAHTAFSDIPAIGASGAIYGIMGAFLVYFPRNDVDMFFFFWLIFWVRARTFTLSSYWVIVGWVGLDALELWAGWENGVALWAHMGGFTFGFLAALLCALLGWVKPEEDEETLVQVFTPKRVEPRRAREPMY